MHHQLFHQVCHHIHAMTVANVQYNTLLEEPKSSRALALFLCRFFLSAKMYTKITKSQQSPAIRLQVTPILQETGNEESISNDSGSINKANRALLSTIRYINSA